jgi:hypothetical protein
VSSATRYASDNLILGLIDDAAIFPPGLTPLAEAVERHRALRRSPLSRFIGPFLLRASWWEPFLDLAVDGDDFPFILIARPGGDPADMGAAPIRAALDGLAQRLGMRQASRLRGVEMPLPPTEGERSALMDALAPWNTHVLIAFEIDGTAPDADFAVLAGAGARAGRGMLGKFRTGGIRPEDSPRPDRVAGVIAASVRQQVPVKFTAGLHHAVSGPHGPDGSTQFGVLNVIAAVRQAINGGDATDASRVDALAATLMRQDATAWAAEAISLSIDDADAIRSIFTSFGCCGVTEPLAELAALGVVPARPEGPQA